MRNSAHGTVFVFFRVFGLLLFLSRVLAGKKRLGNGGQFVDGFFSLGIRRWNKFRHGGKIRRGEPSHDCQFSRGDRFAVKAQGLHGMAVDDGQYLPAQVGGCYSFHPAAQARIEPEMVNPKSDLFETHPEWAIHYPNRETYYFRNQLVLDLSNPKVQDFVFGVVDKIMTENPDVAFFKWDCNSPITNIYSPYLKDKQGQLYVDHVRGIYNVLKRVKEKYPNVPMMLCSGGGARCDYEALKYFTEFWCSDNTDPVERLFIQWGFSQFFPAKAMCAHVTSWNSKTSVKFRTDVASMCKLGFDIGLKDMKADELTYCQEAVANYKRLKPVILDGDQYRLVSPYDGNHMAVMYTAPDASKAVLFTYDIHPRFGEKLLPVKLRGLDAQKMYRVKEINLMPGRKSNLSGNEKIFSGDYLMKIGLNAFTTSQTNSRVIELVAE